MHLQRSFWVFLLVLMPEKAKGKYSRDWESTVSLVGLLQVTDRNDMSCHSCLLQMVGVERIVLVASEAQTLTYLIKGPTTMLDSFIIRCNTSWNCILQSEIKKHTPYSMPLPRIENLVIQFAFQINSALMHQQYDKTKEGKSGHFGYSRRYESFFLDEMQFVYPTSNRVRSEDIGDVKMQELLRPKYVSDRKPWLKMSGTEKEGEEDKMVRLKAITCYVQTGKATSQCEKCLALHSSSFGVRPYTVRTPVLAFRTIYVFSTDYSQNLIKRNCNEEICGTMESISSTSCENLDGMFPNNQRMFHKAVRFVQEYGKIANPTTNRINQGNLDIRGMFSSESKFKLGLLLSLHEVKSGAKENTRTDEKPSCKSQEKLFLEEFLSTRLWSCAYLTPPLPERPGLLKCIAYKVAGNKGFFLVISPSITKLTIFSDSYVIKDYILKDCNKRYGSHYKESRDKKDVACDDYRNQHKTNPIVYHELSMVENVISEKKPCLFIQHKMASFKTCGDCMETFFHAVTGGEERTFESNSYLWWTHNEQKTWKAVNHILNNCVVEKRCSNIRLLSEMICSEHEQYWGEMKQSIEQNTDQMIPFNSLTFRLWPPTRYARGRFDNRAILMVTFEAIHTESCVKCMIFRTEVFFFYAPVNDRFGYLWMTQSHTQILQMCIAKNKCINIWYQKAGKELTLRQGMRPWSDSKLQLVFRMHQSRGAISLRNRSLNLIKKDCV